MPDLFDTLVAGGEVELERWCDERRQETVTLEFKAKSKPTHGDFEKDDKRNLGATLSAFANSQGGMQVWGAVARKGSDGIDCLQKLQAISNIERFYAQAQTLVGELLMPRMDGIKLAFIQSSKQSDAGYLVVQVERSDRRPHMSKAPEDGRYYRRAGAQSFRMEHGDIEDAFNRDQKVSLELVHKLEVRRRDQSSDGEEVHIAIMLGISNTSSVTGLFPYLYVKPDTCCHVSALGADGNGRTGLPKLITDGQWHRFAGGANEVVHPGDTVWVSAIICTLAYNKFRRTYFFKNDPAGDAPIHNRLTWTDYRLGCAHTEAKIGVLQVSGIELLGVAGTPTPSMNIR